VSTAGCPASRHDASVLTSAVRVSPGGRTEPSDESSSKVNSDRGHAVSREHEVHYAANGRPASDGRRQHECATVARRPGLSSRSIGASWPRGMPRRGSRRRIAATCRGSSCAYQVQWARRRTGPVKSSHARHAAARTASTAAIQQRTRHPRGRDICPFAVCEESGPVGGHARHHQPARSAVFAGSASTRLGTPTATPRTSRSTVRAANGASCSWVARAE